MLKPKAKAAWTIACDTAQQLAGGACTLAQKIPAQASKPNKLQPLEPCPSYLSKLAINPDVHSLRFKEATDDIWNGSTQTLTTEFDYHGAVISDARVIGNGVSHISVYESNGIRNEAYSWFKTVKPLPWAYKKPIKRIEGVTLHLCGLTEVIRGNYAHWLIDGLSRLILLEDLYSNPPKFDQLLIPPGSPALRDCVMALGFKDEQLIELQTHRCLEFEQLICLSRPRGGNSDVMPGWIIDGYRNRLMPHTEPNIEETKNTKDTATQKIYISRRDASSRKFSEEDRLCEELAQRGYKIIELSKYSLKGKVELFSGATHVIGLSGAGMVSIMFCQPGTKIIEIFPSNFVVYIFNSIAAHLNTNYFHYVFKNSSKVAAMNRYHGQFDMDVDEFCRFLDKL